MSSFRGPGGVERIHKPLDENDSHALDLRLKHPVKGAKFVASPNYYS